MAGSYAAAEDYAALFPGEEAPGEAALRAASAHIDSLTFGRIRAMGGPDALTEFQREAVREAVCRQARFEAENGDMAALSLASYSINGVTMRTGDGEGVRRCGGVAVPGEVLSLMEQTGLCCRLPGRRL